MSTTEKKERISDPGPGPRVEDPESDDVVIQPHKNSPK